ncbi:MAG: helix-turn-helix domain-containing protein [Ignavibacteria bacterium]|nr:helix-turn-helix domain-containing protein [Ignavibacteria bacterium]
MKLYSLTETAKILKKSKQWVWFLIQSGRLKHEKAGRNYVITEEQIQKYLTSNK